MIKNLFMATLATFGLLFVLVWVSLLLDECFGVKGFYEGVVNIMNGGLLALLFFGWLEE